MELIKIIENHERIMLDTAPIIYHIEEKGSLGKISDELFKVIKDRKKYFVFSSVISFSEVLVHPLRSSRKDLVERYRQFLLKSSNFTIYSIDVLIAEKAANLRAKYRLRTPDALQFAVAIENNATLFVTNDKNLNKIINGINRKDICTFINSVIPIICPTSIRKNIYR